MTDVAVTRLPRTTARAIGVGGLLATLAVVAAAPLAGAGALAGGLFAVGALGLARGRRAQALGAAALVLGIAGAIGAVHVAAVRGIGTVALAVVMAVVGASLAFAAAGGVPRVTRSRGVPTLLYGALVAGAAAVCWFVATTAPRVLSNWLARTALVDVVGAIAALTAIAVAALFALPLAAIGRPRRRAPTVYARRRLAAAIAVVGLLAIGGLWLLGFDFPTEGLGDAVAASTAVRGLLVAGGCVGVAVVATGLFLRVAYHQSGLAGFGHLGALIGATAGIGLVAGVAAVAPGVDPHAWTVPALFGTTAGACLAGSLVVLTYRDWLAGGGGPGAPTFLALGLGTAAVVLATAAAGTGATAGLGLAHLATLVALAGALFVARAGRVGRGLAVAVGPDAVARRTQLVHVGWTGAVAVVGLVATGVGYWLATVVAPTLSVPATAGAAAGIVGIGAAAWLLLR